MFWVLVLKLIQLSGAQVADYEKTSEPFALAIPTFVSQESVKEKVIRTSSHST